MNKSIYSSEIRLIVILVLILEILIAIGCGEQVVDISKVRIWDRNFRLVRIINRPEDIEKLETVWTKKEEIKTNKTFNFTYKIDIVSNGRSTRWLYDPSGYVILLSKKKSPAYRIVEFNEFNKLVVPLSRTTTDNSGK